MDERRAQPAEYVTFLEQANLPGSPYGVEGYLHGIEDFASGAVRVHGWRRVTARILVIALLAPIAISVLGWTWSLLLLLLHQ